MFVVIEVQELASGDGGKLFGDQVVSVALKFERTDEIFAELALQPGVDPFEEFFWVAGDVAEDPIYGAYEVWGLGEGVAGFVHDAIHGGDMWSEW